jgi:hypothetical protein
MPTSVYSERLAAQAGYTGTLDVFAPTGFTMVVRDMDVVYDGGSAGEMSVIGTAGQIIWFCSAPGGAEIFQWRGRQVFSQGEFFSMQVNSGSFDFTVSGYHLALP